MTPENPEKRALRLRRICVFCGSSLGARDDYARAAAALGSAIASRGIELVYGGASVGLMGELADAALAAGGTVIGVIPESLHSREVAHRRLSKLHVVPSMHVRKQLMEDLSDGFVALPGGFGTLDEFCEIVTWLQLGFHSKPIGVLNARGFFSSFFTFLDGAVKEGFIRAEHRARIHVADDAATLLDRMQGVRGDASAGTLKSP
jgi:uncharacterized protein (TIGR00730 family)